MRDLSTATWGLVSVAFTLGTAAAAGLHAPAGVWIATAALAVICMVLAGVQHWREGRTDRIADDEAAMVQRRLLARALSAAYQDGARWYGKNVEASVWEPWQKRTWSLIFAALGQGEATCFLSDWSDGEQTLTGLAARLQWLVDLTRRVDSTAPLTMRPDFDGEDWVSRR